MPTIQLLIRGKVQGVFYRASAREAAEGLGLCGWVKNNEDGSVLLRATGPAEELTALEQWCSKGPTRAKVTLVEKTALPEEAFLGFTVLR